MFYILQEHIAFSHNMFLLEKKAKYRFVLYTRKQLRRKKTGLGETRATLFYLFSVENYFFLQHLDSIKFSIQFPFCKENLLDLQTIEEVKSL